MGGLTTSQLLSEETIVQALFSSGIFLVFILISLVASVFFNKIGRGISKHLGNQIGEHLVKGVRRPGQLIILVQGLILSTIPISALDPWRFQIQTVWAVSVIGLATLITARIGNQILSWYGDNVASNAKDNLTSRLVPAIRRMFSLTLYTIAGMLILDQLNISISPLIAGFGIGGIAVALALQPTLGNFFAGTYLVSGDVLKPGDYIGMESGLAGYVVEIGWRSTRLKTAFNNLVVIPNSRLADSIITNYSDPTLEMGVIVSAGVSYDSNLSQVEAIAILAATEIISELPEAKKPFQPWFGFDEFADSNINFWVWVEANDRLGSFRIKSELIKRLHQKFGQSGIEINYPVRKIIFPPSKPELPLGTRDSQ